MRIALVGKMRAGKDTVALLLIEQYGLTPIAFADGITEIIQKYYPEALEKGKPRKHYQHIGQSLRELNPNIWINHLDRRTKEIDNIIVTDCRQKNEELYLRKNGFKIIMVEADEDIRIERIIKSGDVFNPALFIHDTEKQVDLIESDYIISNNGTYEELQGEVNRAFEWYREGMDVE